MKLGASVLDFGAKGDGATDDTASIQAALDSLATTGGTALLPPGRYRISSLTVPVGVSLQGTYTFKSTGTGSWLHCVGRDDPALTLTGGNSVRELAFFYPEQHWDGAREQPGIAYPPSISLADHAYRILIEDVFLPNTYEAIDASRPHQYLILRNVQGYAINRGVVADASFDIDRYTTVHFNINSFWEIRDSADEQVQALAAWTRRHGTAFTVRRADWLVMLDCFCWGYRTGLRLEESPAGHGSPGGIHVIGSGFDACGTCVDMADGWGIRITDCFFVSFNHWEPGTATADAAVTATGGGELVLKNCRWWGCDHSAAAVACSQSAIDGNGFNDYGRLGKEEGRDYPALTLGRGIHQVIGNQFSGRRVYLAERPSELNAGTSGLAVTAAAEAAVVTGNVFASMDKGSVSIEGDPRRVLLHANIHKASRPGTDATADLVLES